MSSYSSTKPNTSTTPPTPSSTSTSTSCFSNSTDGDISSIPAFQVVNNIMKWKGRTERLNAMMTSAKQIAERKHNQLEAIKKRSPNRKPTKAVTARQKSSKKSAEICRAKMGIYINLLEDAVKEEQTRENDLQHALLLQTQMNATVKAKIADLQNKKQQQQQQFEQQQQKQQLHEQQQQQQQHEQYQISQGASSFFSEISSSVQSHSNSDDYTFEQERTTDTNIYADWNISELQLDNSFTGIEEFLSVPHLDSPTSPISDTNDAITNEILQEALSLCN